MKWLRSVILILWLAFAGCLIVLLYPDVAPLVVHPPKHGWLVALFQNMSHTQGKASLTQGPMPWIVVTIIVLLLFSMNLQQRTKPRTTHGSAHRATRREMHPFVHSSRRLSLPVRMPTLPLPRPRQVPALVNRFPQRVTPRESRLVLGTAHGRVIALSEKQQESNVLLTAPVGAGKTSRVIVPNLLTEEGHRSLFIADVKGELVRLTAGQVSQFHEVWVFSPDKPDQSEGYNPLALIHTVEDAQEFASCWVANTGKSKEDFWPNAAIHLMTATMLHLRTAESDAPFGRVADILCHSRYESMKRLLLSSPSRQAREEVTAFFDYVDKNPKLVGSLMADIGTRFQVLVSENVRAVTARHDLDFAAMAERPIALYLSIPRRYQNRYQPLLACFMRQMFAAWEARAEQEPGGCLPQDIMCYLDEFANLGYIPQMSDYISTARHSGVGMLIVLQSFSQLDEKYGEAVRKTMLNGCVTHLLLPGAGLDETEYYSRRLGMTTVRTHTRHTSSGNGEGRESWTEGETGRRLLTPDELRTMSEDEMLMLSGAVAPLILKTTPYYRIARLLQKVMLPFPHVRVYQQQPQPPPTPPTSPAIPDPPTQPPVISTPMPTQLTKKTTKTGNEKYFLRE